MGTRNLIEVKYKGETKVAQYGQWNGYPTGQGADIARFLHSGYDHGKFFEALSKCRFMGEKDNGLFDALNALPEEDWKKACPQFSRDTGAFVLWLIYGSRGRGLLLKDNSEFKNDYVFCEYNYLIDMDSKTVSVNECRPIPFAEWTEELMGRMKEDGIDAAAGKVGMSDGN